MTNKCSVLAYIIAAVCGVSLWISISWISGQSEAWDSQLYYKYGIPISVIIAGILGYICPTKPWRWPLTITLSQASLAIIQNPSANLLPLGLVAFGIFAIPSLLSAYLGTFLRNRSEKMRARIG